MSGFFGIFRPQGGSVDLEAFEQMRKATEREGFDGLETHVEEKIAMGHLMLRVSPEAKYDQQPLHSECGRYLLVGHFRLDYRDELGDKLGLTQSELELTPDSQLVMLAYQKWKDQCVNHIEGDWAFALFDRIENAFFIAKDKFGHSALFFSKYQDAIYFSSDVTVFDKLISFHKEIDYKQLTRLSIPGLEMEFGKTLLIGLEYLPTSTFLIYSSSLEKTQLKYWELYTGNLFSYHDLEDQIEEFRSVLVSAIVSRIRTKEKLGLFLSSGLDSTTIAHYISEFMHLNGTNLNSYTSIPAYLDSYPKEKHQRISEESSVREFIAEKNNISAKFLDFSNSSIGEILQSNRTLDKFHPVVSMNRFWLDGIFSEAKNDKVRRILNGQLGNYVITWSAQNKLMWDFLNFRLLILFRELNLFAINKSISFYKVFKYEVIKPLYVQINSYIKSSRFFINKHLFEYSIFKHQNADIVLQKSESNNGLLLPGLSYEKKGGQHRKEILLKGALRGGMLSFIDSHSYSMESSDPTSDVRLIEYAFKIDQSLFNKAGQAKFIFRKMMEGVLPFQILHYKGVFPQSYDIPIRLKNDKMFKELTNGILIDSTYRERIRTDFLEIMYETVKSNKNTMVEVKFSNLLLRSLSIICFLRKNE